MSFIKNPARSRPLSANVKRLMKMARESPQNPDVEKIEREFTARDLAYCDMWETSSWLRWTRIFLWIILLQHS